MHDSVRAFVARVVDTYGLGGDILEVGSFDVNGGVRDLLPAISYRGIDIRPGPGVDEVVEPGLNWYLRHRSYYDVVVSTEMLEHDPRPWQTVIGMGHALRPNGALVLTCRGFGENGAYGLHDYPADYWRPSVEAIKVLLHDAHLGIVEIGPDTDDTAPGVFAVARR